MIHEEVAAIRDNIKGGALTETTFLVLLSVYQPNHGYSIMKFIEQATNGRVVLGAGTLYGAINALLKKKWIAPVADTDNSINNSNKKEYIITDLGMQAAEKELARITDLERLAARIIGGELT
jgi:DNA-binding PadR family transcriptional regulator